MSIPCQTQERAFVLRDPHLSIPSGECLDNLAHSNVTPRAINGTTLQSLGNIPKVTFTLHGRKAKKDVHLSVASQLASA